MLWPFTWPLRPEWAKGLFINDIIIFGEVSRPPLPLVIKSSFGNNNKLLMNLMEKVGMIAMIMDERILVAMDG